MPYRLLFVSTVTLLIILSIRAAFTMSGEILPGRFQYPWRFSYREEYIALYFDSPFMGYDHLFLSWIYFYVYAMLDEHMFLVLGNNTERQITMPWLQARGTVKWFPSFALTSFEKEQWIAYLNYWFEEVFRNDFFVVRRSSAYGFGLYARQTMSTRQPIDVFGFLQPVSRRMKNAIPDLNNTIPCIFFCEAKQFVMYGLLSLVNHGTDSRFEFVNCKRFRDEFVDVVNVCDHFTQSYEERVDEEVVIGHDESWIEVSTFPPLKPSLKRPIAEVTIENGIQLMHVDNQPYRGIHLRFTDEHDDDRKPYKEYIFVDEQLLVDYNVDYENDCGYI
jgi:hypothetical protein